MHTTTSRHLFGVLLIGFLLSACGGAEESQSTDATLAPDNRQEVQDYYAARPDFFSFKTLADLPADLDWQDGIPVHRPEYPEHARIEHLNRRGPGRNQPRSGELLICSESARFGQSGITLSCTLPPW